MNKETLELFKALTEFPAASGFERELRQFVEKRLAPYADEIIRDRIGGIFGVKKGAEDGPRIMVAGHLDEVGFMVTQITGSGLIKFQPLGGWNNQVLLAQRMQVITPQGPVIGVIGSVPPHLLKDSDRGKAPEIGAMYLDVGADDAENARSMGLMPGQQIVPICPFTPMANPKKIMAKAWDNRYGVGLAIELLQELERTPHPNIVFSGATAQEEVGLRGAGPAAELIRPDLFLGLDASPANDATGDKQAFGQLGQGALLRIMDKGMITHRGMVEFVRDTADTHRIPYQYFVSPGGTDAGAVHVHGIGVPSAVIGVCSRYIHTSAAILHTDDYAAAKELLVQLVKAADRTTVETIVQY
ncbi:M42 family metallopeptidase [Paenibacillus sp. y28]|uniref:M42 family metallopeptidase n=1 Tax=Paenibacillus sp. y28 TaxID=3129110 RepID=UPI00301B5DDD